MGPAGLELVARELYGLPPEEFTAARDTAVREARAAGDRLLATSLKGLRRPSVAAWAVNLLARERAELLAQVVELGGSLREAQAALEGSALRDLTRQRRQLVAAVTQEAGAVASAHGQRLSSAAERQVEETLQAAMTDPAAAQAVRSGLLAQPLSSTGVESLVAAPGISPQATPVDAEPAEVGDAPPPGADRPGLTVVRDEDLRRRRAAERAAERVAQTAKALRKATKARDRAVKARAKAQARVLQAEVELEELRARVAAAEAEAEAAAQALTDRDAEVAGAEATLGDAQAAALAAQAVADRGDHLDGQPAAPRS